MEESFESWIFENGFQDYGSFDLYVVSFYFVITTIATVGYGDISPWTTPERIIGVIIVILGVTSFTFATGSLSSLMTNLDSAGAKLKQKMDLLDQIKWEYNLSPIFYEKIWQEIKF